MSARTLLSTAYYDCESALDVHSPASRCWWRRWGLTTFASRLVGVIVCAPSALAQPLPAYRSLPPFEVRSALDLASVAGVRPLSDGRVVIHDVRRRRVTILSPTLDSLATVADVTSATGALYGTRVAGMVAWKGDSTLFIDTESLTMAVLDPRGQVARLIALPAALDRRCLLGGPSGNPALDAQGRILCLASPRRRLDTTSRAGQVIPLPQFADTAPLVRYTPATRTVDTLAYLRVPLTRMTLTQDESCTWVVSPRIDPLPLVDGWALLTDGSVAVLRGRDYSVQWISPDGSVTAPRRLPYSPRRLDDAQKTAYLDSARMALETLRALNAGGRPTGPAEPGVRCDSTSARSLRVFLPEAVQGTAAGGSGGREGAPPLLFVSPDELPDYVPPFGQGSAFADRSGRVWIRLLEEVDRRPVYHIIDRDGTVTARVLLPPGRVVIGFGERGAVYMAVAEQGHVYLERSRLESDLR